MSMVKLLTLVSKEAENYHKRKQTNIFTEENIRLKIRERGDIDRDWKNTEKDRNQWNK